MELVRQQTSPSNQRGPTSFPTDAKDVPNYIRSFVRDNDLARETRTVLTDLFERHYRGHQWVRFDRQFGRTYADIDIMNGIIINLTRYAVDSAVASMTQSKYIPVAFSPMKNTAGARSERVGTAILNQVFSDNGGFGREKSRCRNLLIRGNHFERVEIDKNALDSLVFKDQFELQAYMQLSQTEPLDVQPYDMGRLKCLFKVGKIVIRDVHPSSVIVPNGITNFSDARRFAVATFKPVENIRAIAEEFGADLDRIQPQHVMDSRRANTSYAASNTAYMNWAYDQRKDSQEQFEFGVTSGMAGLLEYWEQDSSGRWFVTYSTGNDFSIYLGGRGGFQNHPFVDYTAWEQPGLMWGMSHIEDLVGVQTIYNKIATEKLLYYIRSMKNVLLVPRGSNPAGFSTEGGDTIVEFSAGSGMPAQFVGLGHQVISVLSGMHSEFERIFFLLSRISEVSRGEVPDRVSSDTMAMGLKKDQATLEELYTRVQSREAVCNSKVLALARSDEFGLSRVVAYVGEDHKTEVMEFRNTELSGDMILRTKHIPPVVETADERRKQLPEIMAVLQQAGAGPGEIMDMSIEYAETGRSPLSKTQMQVFTDEQTNVEEMLFDQFALNESVITLAPVQDVGPEGIENTPPTMVNTHTGLPLLQPYHDDDEHLKRHELYIADPSTPEPSRRAAMMHAEEHRRRVEERRQQAIAEQQQQESAMSIAQSAGTILAAQIASENQKEIASMRDAQKPKQTPRDGGVKSGQSRRKSAA